MQSNVTASGTFEHEIATLLSTLMGERRDPITQVLRNIIFAQTEANEVDWVNAARMIAYYFPEQSKTVNSIMLKYGVI